MSYLGRKSGRAALISDDIPDNSITSAKILADAVGSSDLAPDIALTGGSVGIPSVTTANLPGASGGTNASQTATNGMLVYNSTLGMLQQYSSGVWAGITTAPVITSFTYSDGASATAEKTVATVISCTTQTSTTVLVPGVTSAIIVGQVVSGAGVPLGATVVSIVTDTSFVLSSAATASATTNLTFGGVVTITGTNFDSILAGASANIGVTFDGTSATSISVNSLKTIITCTPPAHAAGTITMQVKNASGLAASVDFVYDIEPIFTTAAGSLGSFDDGSYTANASAPRIQGTEDGVALTTGFQRVTSASDDTVITTTIAGLTVLTSGYLTGTLAGGSNTTYPFYATAMDNENQRTAPRLFNIISNPPNYTRPGDGPYDTDSYTKLLIHSDTSNNSTVFADSGTNTHTITTAGTVKHDTAQNKIGATSITFPGNASASITDWLILQDHDDWDFGTGDFTLDCWMYPLGYGVSGYASLFSFTNISNTSNSPNNFRFDAATGKMHWESTSGNLIMTGTIPLNAWTHLAFVREGTTVKYYKGGVLDSTHAGVSTDFSSLDGGIITVGSSWNGYTLAHGWYGYLDEVRISKGIARWTSAFTVY